MGVHYCSTMSRTMLVQASLCELGIRFPEAKTALTGLGGPEGKNIDRKSVG